MVETNHNPKEYSPEEVANLVDRTANLIRLYCNENKIDHRKFGRSYIISELGLEQARQITQNSKPGPKGPRTKVAGGRRKAA